MECIETCVICRTADVADRLGGWYIGPERRAVHIDCWLGAYGQKAADPAAAAATARV